jgi:hypothetical protein
VTEAERDKRRDGSEDVRATATMVTWEVPGDPASSRPVKRDRTMTRKRQRLSKVTEATATTVRRRRGLHVAWEIAEAESTRNRVQWRTGGCSISYYRNQIESHGLHCSRNGEQGSKEQI